MAEVVATRSPESEADGRACPIVVIINARPLSDWDYQRLGFATFRRMGLEVIYVDAEAFKTHAWRQTAELNGVPNVADPEDLRRRLAFRREIFVLTSHDLSSPELRSLAQVLAELNVPWCQTVTCLIPSPMAPESISGQVRYLSFKARQLLRRDGFAGGMRRLFERLRASAAVPARSRKSFCAPQYLLACGTSWSRQIVNKTAKVIPGHSQDYELARIEGLLRPVAAENICVFIDQNETAHPDFAALGIGGSDLPDAGWYFAALSRCFRAIETATGLRVVILPHPRTDPTPGLFGPYEIRPGDTIKSVARCKLVVGHYSTALGLAALFDKPVVLLTARAFSRIMGGQIERMIAAFQEALGCQKFSMDEPNPAELQDWAKVDSRKYAEYRDRYLKYPDSGDESMWGNAISYIAQDQGWNIELDRS